MTIVLCGSCNSVQDVVTDTIEPVESDFRIAFGSCSKTDLEQHLWDDILNISPDAWIWLGDIIYGDTENMAILSAKYDQQNLDPGYTALKQATSIYGVWDDHDYGVNNSGKEYPMKYESRNILFDFLEIDSADADRGHVGAFNEEILKLGEIDVHLVLLDVRYFRDPLEYRLGRPKPNTTGTILGPAQWEWLENILDTTASDLVVLGSGIQVLPEDHNYEKWANFPAERQRLIELIRRQDQPVILISGDRHFGEISKIDSPNEPYSIYEVTSSSLTHSWSSASEFNQHREGRIVTRDNFGTIEFKISADSCKVYLSLQTENGRIAERSQFTFSLEK